MRRRVLVVEDEADLAETCQRLLRRLGYEITCAGSSREGIALIEHEAPGLVISDLRLPDGSGIDVVTAARRTPRPVPVIVVTGFPSTASRRAALDAGAAAYLAKPFSASALTSLVQDVFGAGSR